MLTLTAQEKETILLTTEADHTVTICTYNEPLKQTLAAFAARFPAVCSLMYKTEEGRVTWSVDKAWLPLCFLPRMLEDAAARLQAVGF